jgi:hypothetical protein
LAIGSLPADTRFTVAWLLAVEGDGLEKPQGR